VVSIEREKRYEKRREGILYFFLVLGGLFLGFKALSARTKLKKEGYIGPYGEA
jgi:hypothetical protein